MRTKTDITLLPCPFCGGEAEMDTRQGYLALGTGRLGNRIAVYCRSCNADMGVCIEDVPDIEPEQVANMWNRRSAVEADRQGRVPSDEEILALAECARVWVPMGSGPEKERSLQALRSLITTALSRYSSGLPAASAKPHVWGYAVINPKEPGWPHELALDKSHASRIAASLYASKIIPLVAMTDAPVAQEPVGVVGDDFALYWIGSGPIAPIVERHGLKVGSKLYASPAAAQAQPDVQTLIAYAEGRIKHVNEGECPDNIEGHDTRDPDCPVCRALMGTIHAQPAMPPLTEAMRAVLRNENDIYGSEDAMYAALCDAAQAQPSASLKPDMQRESQRGAESGRDREDAERYRWATALDDNTHTLHSIVLSYGGDQAKINECVDVYRACDARAAKGADHG